MYTELELPGIRFSLIFNVEKAAPSNILAV